MVSESQEHWLEKGEGGGDLGGAPGPWFRLAGGGGDTGIRLRRVEQSMFSGIHTRCLIAEHCAGPGDD